MVLTRGGGKENTGSVIRRERDEDNKPLGNQGRVGRGLFSDAIMTYRDNNPLYFVFIWRKSIVGGLTGGGIESDNSGRLNIELSNHCSPVSLSTNYSC